MSDLLREADTWLPLDVDEADYVPVDFADKIGADSADTIASVAVTCEVLDGVDADASTRISGAAQVSGTLAQQLVTGALVDVTYLVRFKATLTPSGRIVVIAGRLPVVRES